MYACVHCGKQAPLKCSVCKLSRYCSRECQKRHWPLHKRSCKDINYDSKMIKAVALKLASREFIGHQHFLSSYMMSVRCCCTLYLNISQEQCREFLDGRLDISALVGITRIPIVSEVPKNDLLLIVDGIRYYFLLGYTSLEKHFENYDDVRTLYDTDDDMKLFTGNRIKEIISNLYEEEEHQSIMKEIVERDGGVVEGKEDDSREGRVCTKSYIF